MNKDIVRKLYFGFAASGLVYAMGGSSVALAAPAIPSDFDGDRKTDFAVIHPSHPGPTPTLGQLFWRARRSFAGPNDQIVQFGLTTDFVVPGDYDGDGKTDQAIYRPSTGQWFLNGQGVISFGISTDTPVPADYDGDGKTDVAVVRVGVPDRGGALTWFVNLSSRPVDGGGQPCILSWGLPTDIPVPADYDGDGRSELAVFRPDTGRWFIMGKDCVSPGAGFEVPFGLAGDEPVSGDYDGDGKFDLAVFRPKTETNGTPTNGTWFVLNSSNGQVQQFLLGRPSDRRVPGDYDGDGIWDFAVYRPSANTSPNSSKWIVRRSTTRQIVEQLFGDQTDLPVPSAYTFREPLPRRTGF